MTERESSYKRKPIQDRVIDRLSQEMFFGDTVERFQIVPDENGNEGFVTLKERIHAYFDIRNPKQCEVIEKIVLGRFNELKGGCDMFAWDDVDLSQDSTDSI